MIFNEERKVMFWVLAKEPIVTEYRNQVLGCYENMPATPLNENETVVWEGADLLIHPKLTDNGLVEATAKDLLDKGMYRLADNEVLVGEDVKMLYEFPIPEELVKPALNYETLTWEETATPEELEEAAWDAEVVFYNEELDFASKAHAELACEIITAEMFEEVKLYMKEIDPYRITKKKKKKGKATVKASRPQRPPVFDRYN